MKHLGKYLVLVGLSLIVACGNPPEPPPVTLTTSELNPVVGSSVTFTAIAAPADKIVKLELLEGTTVLETVEDTATLETAVPMGVVGKRSFTARATDAAGVVATSAVVEVDTKAAIGADITASLGASNLNPFLGSSVKFSAAALPADQIKKLELLAGTTVLKTVDDTASFELDVVMDSVGAKSFTTRATSKSGVVVSSAVVEVNTKVVNPVVQVAMGFGHTCALFDDSDVRCWGKNSSGQLGLGNKILIAGDGTVIERNFLGDDEAVISVLPIKFPIRFKVKQITAGSDHTCALSEEGKVICWGKNEFGQLGYGDITDRGDTPDTTPDKLGFLDLPRVKSIVSGNNANHTCAILFFSQAVKCWGENNAGQLGLGNTNNIGDAPSELENTPAINLGVSRVKQIAVNGDHTCALLQDNTLRCWGLNSNGQLGYGNTATFGEVTGETPNTKEVDIADATQISLGNTHTCVITTSKKVRCWGKNSSGQLGYGNENDIGNNELPDTAGFVSIGADVKQLSTGRDHNCVLLTDAKIKCWGAGTTSEGTQAALGYGNRDPIGDNELPSNVGIVQLNTNTTQSKVITIFSGGAHNCALFESGIIKCWGFNFHGELGYGNRDSIGDNELPSSVGVVPLF
jgi:alpha-tubulin suppressor-like RCC1 family protein